MAVNLSTPEALGHVLLDISLDAVVAMDEHGRVVEFNAAAETMFGYRRAEALGRLLGDLIVPAHLREQHERGFRRLLETGESSVLGRRIQLEAMRADGSVFPVELAIARAGQDCLLFVGFVRDITATIDAEREIRAAELRYRTLVEQLPLATYRNAASDSPATLYMSPQIEELLGYPATAWLGADNAFYKSVLHPDDLEHANAEYARAQATSTPFRCESRMLHEDGSVRWILDQSAVVCDESGEPLFTQGFLLDITERKQLEEQLRQSQKMEAIGQLAGGIAHDFNNMLTAINGYAELLGMTFEDGDPRQGDVDELKRAAGHAAALTRQLLAFSRKQVLLPQRLDANEIVSELELMLHRTIGEQIELETVLDPRPAEVEADRDQLAQVVLNIALNARDAMPAGGRLTIATRDVELSSGPHVAIEIHDTGSGMDEETRLRVFEPFFTTKEVGKGTGLGLATAYGVVSQSGGSIEVESEEGRGSTFRVLLPRVAALSPRAAA